MRRFQNLFFRLGVRYANNYYKGSFVAHGLFNDWKNEYDLNINIFGPEFYVFYTLMKNSRGRFFGGIGGCVNFTKYSKNLYSSTNMSTGENYNTPDYGKFGNWSE